jgi:putative transposase
MIERLSYAEASVDRACRVLGGARQNYYKHKRAPTTPSQLRRRWLSGLIREVHVGSRGT